MGEVTCTLAEMTDEELAAAVVRAEVAASKELADFWTRERGRVKSLLSVIRSARRRLEEFIGDPLFLCSGGLECRLCRVWATEGEFVRHAETCPTSIWIWLKQAEEEAKRDWGLDVSIPQRNG